MLKVDPLVERAYSLHCRGLAVPEIAAIMKIGDDAARELIVEYWAEDRRQAALESKAEG